MKNLVTVEESWSQLPRDLIQEGDNVVAYAEDHDGGIVYFVTKDGSIIGQNAVGKITLHLPLTSAQEEGNPPFLESAAEAVALDWLPEQEALAVASSHGDLLLVHTASMEVEAVGMLEGGVAGMSWSPDGEVVAIATGAAKLLLMTKDWDVLAEVCLDVTNESSKSQPANGHSASERVSMSWRGDGKYFATSAYGRVTVWERGGCVMHACAEEVSGLQSHVAWQPRGALIAAVHVNHAAKTPSVVLFERNGLRKGGFELDTVPFGAEVQSMQWNASSELLGIALTWDDVTVVQIWCRSNYHWYLKREWRECRAAVGILNFSWHPESPLRLHLWVSKGAHSHLQLSWQSAVTSDSCTALVIDGPRVRITPLLEAVIPPPMCAAAIGFGAPVQATCLVADESGVGELVAAVMSDGRIGLAQCNRKGRWEDWESESEGKYGEPIVKAEMLEGVIASDRVLGFAKEPMTLISAERRAFSLDSRSGGDVLRTFRLALQSASDERGSFTLERTESHHIGGRLLRYIPVPESERDLLLLDGGLLQWWNPSGRCEDFVRLAEAKKGAVTRIEALHVGSSIQVLALIAGKLFLMNECIATGVTSFVSRGGRKAGQTEGGAAYAIWTTQKDELLVAEVGETRLGKQHAIPLHEKGATLVASIGEEAGVLIQTPRGNLETLYPRQLVLVTAVQALRAKDYAQALEVCRRHRLDLNLVVDYEGWENFVQHAYEFVTAVKSPSKIAELVTALKEGDVTKQAYGSLLPPWNEKAGDGVAQPLPFAAPPEQKKVTAVCKAIRESLLRNEETSGSVGLCILATHARSQPPQLKEALRMLKELRRAELQRDPNAALADMAPAKADEDLEEGGPVVSDAAPLTADRAMQHLIWLCGDADALYDLALGMYDLELAAMVAAQAQMDPKEFLPYLQSLAALSSPLRKYTIDRKLGRWESALRHLAQAGEEHLGTCLDILSLHPELYSVASNAIFVEKQPARKAILEAWGDHLVRAEAFEEAAMVFLAGGHLKQAFGAYRTGGLWRQMFCVAGQMNLSKSATVELAREVSEELEALGRPGDAAYVSLEYLDDVSRGIDLLVEAGEWSEAVRIAYARDQGQLVADVILPAAVTSARARLSELQEGQEKVGKYLVRFQAVRQRRLQLAARVGPTGAENPDDDGASVASTATSTAMSGYSAYSHGTNMSGKSSRKTKKKLQQGGGKIRAGSPEEETALVTHLVGLRLSEPLKIELRQLTEVLVMLREEALARQVQAKVNALHKAQEQAVAEAQSAQAEDKAAASEQAERTRLARKAGNEETATASFVQSFVGDHNVGKRSGKLEFRSKPSFASSILGQADELVNRSASSGGWQVLGI